MPFSRRFVIDSMKLGEHKHVIHGLVEVDVTLARKQIADSGRDLSFTAYVVACLARSIGEHPITNAYRSWRGDLVTFDDVDVCVIVETERTDRSFPLPVVLRRAQERTVEDLTSEIRRAQVAPSAPGKTRLSRIGGYIPGPIRRAGMRLALASPLFVKKQVGTAVVSSIGMFGSAPGFGIAFPTVYTTALVVGSISDKLVTSQDGPSELRECLSLTISFDHDIVDGGPAARFTSTLVAHLEGAELLAN